MKRSKVPLRRDSRGSISVEFALALPVLLILLGGVYDLTNAFITWRRMVVTADAITQITTSFLANPAISPGNITLQAHYALEATDAVFDYFPEWESTPPSTLSITLSSIKTTSPTTASTVWTYSSPRTSSANPRNCSLTAGASGSMATLPGGVFGSPYLIVVDISVIYVPLLMKMLAPSGLTLKASAYLTPRVYTVLAPIGYNPLPDGNVKCAP